MTLVTTLIIALIWTVVSIIWFVACLGNKHKEDRWWDYILSVPMFIIVYTIYYISVIVRKLKG